MPRCERCQHWSGQRPEVRGTCGLTQRETYYCTTCWSFTRRVVAVVSADGTDPARRPGSEK